MKKILAINDIRAKAENQRQELRQYCHNCTDNQILHVYELEKNRFNQISLPEYSEVAQIAKVFADEAKQEINRRCL